MTISKIVLRQICWIFDAIALRLAEYIEDTRWRRRTLKSLKQRRRG